MLNNHVNPLIMKIVVQTFLIIYNKEVYNLGASLKGANSTPANSDFNCINRSVYNSLFLN